MNFQEIEQRVAEIDVHQGFDFIYDLLRAYGKPKAAVTRLQKGDYNRSECEGELLWKGQVYYRLVEAGAGDLHSLIDDVKTEERIIRERPRFLIVRDSEHLLARDMHNQATLDISLAELADHAAFFMPWAGIEKTQLESTSYADIKAAEKMAKLYDEIIKHNKISTDSETHELNIFFSRLLFCFFAEDTGVFPEGSFTNAIGSLTKANGEDLDNFLNELFKVLDTDHEARAAIQSHFRGFGYVNGNLFAERVGAPRFTTKARNIVLECGTLDWSQINPDIFGSMIQVVVHPSQREGLGMHYTSAENILKLIRPLFLDSLYEEFEVFFESEKKLKQLLNRIYSIQIFDPACGSGNFLIISYKELRRLEHRVLQKIAELNPKQRAGQLITHSDIKLENFYGIEIDDFAHEIAILSLWLAKHQMNVEFKELFGIEIPLLPLKDSGNIVCGNATRVDWAELCRHEPGYETYICSNPPYLGSRNQTAEQKADLKLHHTRYKSLDYVCSWVILAAQAIEQNAVTAAGLVTTNSITQGEQVSLLWPGILAQGIEIAFAHQSFQWTNDARGNAGVTCVIVGLRHRSTAKKKLYSDGSVRSVDNISPYLTSGGNTTVSRRSALLASALPPMTYGCMPNDGGNLILNLVERAALVSECKDIERFIKPYVGAQEFLKGSQRWCLYIEDSEVATAEKCAAVKSRLEAVAHHRRQSSEQSTRRLADHPNRFYFSCYSETQPVIVPSVSSERREYIPIGFLDKSTVISNLANAIYDAEPWTLGLIQSRIHMVWVRAVAGRLKTDYRYSAVLVYNTFPVPNLTAEDKENLTKHVFHVLGAREQFSDQTLAQLYDPDKMPNVLRQAHGQLDECVDRLYRKREFESDEERLEVLFDMYEAMTMGNKLVHDA